MMAPDVAAHGFPSETGRHSAVAKTDSDRRCVVPGGACEEELEAGRAIRAEPEPGYVFVFGQPVTVVRPGPVGSAPGVQVPVRCQAGDFLKQLDQNAYGADARSPFWSSSIFPVMPL